MYLLFWDTEGKRRVLSSIAMIPGPNRGHIGSRSRATLSPLCFYQTPLPYNMSCCLNSQRQAKGVPSLCIGRETESKRVGNWDSPAGWRLPGISSSQDLESTAWSEKSPHQLCAHGKEALPLCASVSHLCYGKKKRNLLWGWRGDCRGSCVQPAGD